ncbi:tail tube protein [Pseudomonas phage vB_PseuGesM_254]|uniref:Tail tube protein n=1 Tax=Pseudomonas phage vB_PseuGesM_254 TaxID=3092638 RepID=A0AAX4G6F2_9CAUD|nr:tail tube protein [Pseudomonas phage PseuGes_254]
MALMTYSPKDVLVTIAGLHTATGYADGQFIKITKGSRNVERLRAMDGETCRIFRKDENYKFELTLAQSSATNNFLTTLYNIDVATRLGKFPILMKDTKGQSTFFSGIAWIEDMPDVVFSNQMETRTWVFTCTYAGITIGGNADTGFMEDALLLGSSFLPILKEFGVF